MNERYCMYFGKSESDEDIRDHVARKVREYLKAMPDGKVNLSVSTKDGKIDFMEITAVKR